LAASWKPSRWFAFANQQAFKPADRNIGGPGEFGPNPSGFSIVRWKGIGLAKPLDLVHEFPPAERLYLDKLAQFAGHDMGFARADQSPAT
jgi:hypothetical protein